MTANTTTVLPDARARLVSDLDRHASAIYKDYAQSDLWSALVAARDALSTPPASDAAVPGKAREAYDPFCDPCARRGCACVAHGGVPDFDLSARDGRAMLAAAPKVASDTGAGLREKIARLIAPVEWRRYDATLLPFIENRGAHEGESWHVRAYMAGCRTADEARRWWLETAENEPADVHILRASLKTADTILAALATDATDGAGLREKIARIFCAFDNDGIASASVPQNAAFFLHWLAEDPQYYEAADAVIAALATDATDGGNNDRS